MPCSLHALAKRSADGSMYLNPSTFGSDISSIDQNLAPVIRLVLYAAYASPDGSAAPYSQVASNNTTEGSTKSGEVGPITRGTLVD